MHLRLAGTLAFLAMALLAFCSSVNAESSSKELILGKDDSVHLKSWDHYNYVLVGPVFGQPVLGSEDTRRGQVYYLGRAFFSRKLSNSHVPGYFVTEIYFNNTIGGGYDFFPKNVLHQYGYAFAVRLAPHWLPHTPVFLDLGWGFSYGDTTTVDINAAYNSTPWIGLGTTWEVGTYRGMAEVRFFHTSNAGTSPPNQGNNQLQYLVGIQF